MHNDKMGNAVIKRDSKDNWAKAKNYIPPIGTIIILDGDSNSELKFGDGKTLINDLPNFNLVEEKGIPQVYENEELIEFK